MIQDVPKSRVVDLITKLDISKYNGHFKPSQLSNFITNCDEQCLEFFDIAVIEGTKSEKKVEIAGKEITTISVVVVPLL